MTPDDPFFQLIENIAGSLKSIALSLERLNTILEDEANLIGQLDDISTSVDRIAFQMENNQ